MGLAMGQYEGAKRWGRGRNRELPVVRQGVIVAGEAGVPVVWRACAGGRVAARQSRERTCRSRRF